MRGSSPVLLAALFALLGSIPEARAVPLCDDEQSLVPAAELERLDQEKGRAAETADIILPCAVAESGDLGPLCVDATGWLITQTGVVLCQFAVLHTAPEPLTFDERPSERAAQFTAFSAAGLPLSTTDVAPPLGHERFPADAACVAWLSALLVERPIVPG